MTLLERLRCLLTFGRGVALPLPEFNQAQDPFKLFELWFNDAKKSGMLLPEAVSVSTCSRDGQPSSRMVLLKEFNQDGFVFYTNYGSRKSHELVENSKIALLFHWNVLQRQIRIEGTVTKTSKQQSKNYFHSRDRGSQIGAWASRQSDKIPEDQRLSQQFSDYEQEFKGKSVPLPEFWGGWQVTPNYFEFWQGRASRLHDRLTFEKEQDSNNWQTNKLYP